ncbi:hypothetical protein [Streptomyces sp. NPDC058757]|uniref:hypothetical protein n=1 Tax=Streptomyces sp. NPDC058757 TaxID=3346626 RepID=UPI0036B2B58C
MSENDTKSAEIVNRHVAAQEALAKASAGTPEAFAEAQIEARAAAEAYAADLTARGFQVPHGLIEK